MKYLKKFESFYDNEVLKFLYQLDEIENDLSGRSDESWGMWVNYTFDESIDHILIEMGASGYSEGWNRDMKIYYNEFSVGPIRVEEYECEDGARIEKNMYDSYEDIVEEIKSHFGLK